jgi:hypothetical protein
LIVWFVSPSFHVSAQSKHSTQNHLVSSNQSATPKAPVSFSSVRVWKKHGVNTYMQPVVYSTVCNKKKASASEGELRCRVVVVVVVVVVDIFKDPFDYSNTLIVQWLPCDGSVLPIIVYYVFILALASTR